MKHWLAVKFIWLGFLMLEPEVKEDVFFLLGIAGRKGII